MIQFISDKVSIKTGKADNSAVVSFEVGEYEVTKLKELVGLVDKNMKITIEVQE